MRGGGAVFQTQDGSRGSERKREDEGEAEANLSILEASDRQTDRQQFAAGADGFRWDQACQQMPITFIHT